MTKDLYIYPAILEYEGEEILIHFPDLEGCNTFGENDEDALYMAKDALGLYIACTEEDKEELPAPTPLNEIKLKSNQRVILVEVLFLHGSTLSQKKIILIFRECYNLH